MILSSLLVGLFKFPADLVLFRMIPGTTVGVLVGDLTYTESASAAGDVTRPPLTVGLDAAYSLANSAAPHPQPNPRRRR